MMGYVRLLDDAIVRRSTLMDESEIPHDTYAPEHLETAYASLAYRVREETRERDRLARRTRRRALGLALFLMVLLPLFVQALLWWGSDLGIWVTVISFLLGAYKGAGVVGLRRPSRFERRKVENLAAREHYFFHCERNPASFARLEKENFEREVAQENEKARLLLQDASARAKQPRTSWTIFPRFFRAKRC